MNIEKVESIKNILLQDNYKDFCEFIRLSSRSHDVTNITSMLNSFKNKGICRTPSIEEARNFFKELTNVGVGELTRYGNVYKFEWSTPFSLVFLKRILIEDKSVFENSYDTNEYESVLHTEKILKLEITETTEEQEHFLKHDFLLRPDLKVTLSLPSDFSTNDSERLQSFIRTLPF